MSEVKMKIVDKVPLQVDRSIIIDSVNANTMSWQLQKSIEEANQLISVLLKAKKNVVANEHVCQAIADLYIQISILTEYYGASNIQLFINDKLGKIFNKNRKLSKKLKKVGFTSEQSLDNTG